MPYEEEAQVEQKLGSYGVMHVDGPIVIQRECF